jgi:hypothetical protein
MNTLKIFLIASTLLLTNAANALSNPVIDQCSEESLNTIQLELENIKELADYKLYDKSAVSFINAGYDFSFKKLKQSCKFEPQNADKWYARVKSDMETSAKIIDMGFDAWKDSLPLQ